MPVSSARLGGAFFHHAHAYAIHIINSCPAKNVTDQDGNPTTPFQYSYGRKPSLANFCIVLGCPAYFKHCEPTLCNKKLITYNHQLQRASHDIFTEFPEHSPAGWLVYSRKLPQRIIQIMRDAYFHKDFSSALALLDSNPSFAGAIPILNLIRQI